MLALQRKSSLSVVANGVLSKLTPVGGIATDGTHTNHLTETTGFGGEIYTDPTRELYHKLGMTIGSVKTTPAGEERRSYLRGGFWAGIVQSLLVSLEKVEVNTQLITFPLFVLRKDLYLTQV